MSEIHIDFETRSRADLKKTGVHAYAEDPSTDVICLAWGSGLDDVRSEQVLGVENYRCPDSIVRAALDPKVLFYGHNCAFERAVWRAVLTPRYGWPECPPPSRWRCTMAMAYAMSLPGALGDAALALQSNLQKDDEGKKLMLKMCKPRIPTKKDPREWIEDDASRARLAVYCEGDVLAEIGICQRLVPLRPAEQSMWALDQIINDRGVYVDLGLADAAKRVVAIAQRRLDIEMRALTEGAVDRTSQVSALCLWLSRHMGWELIESLKKDELAELLGRELPGDTPIGDGAVDPGPARQALLLRQEGSKASVKKIDALVLGRSADGRARGLLQYHAASTGRWAGRRFQPQNLKRPELKAQMVLKAIELIKRHGSPDVLEAVFGMPALSIIGDTIRGLIVPERGKQLYAGDFANIEGRGLAWEAGETAKLKVFRDNDAGKGPDPYLVAASGIYRVPVSSLNKESPERQIGKVAELACGYQGGKGAFHAMASGYGVVVSDERAEEIVAGWREIHPETKQFWRDAEDAAIRAVCTPGKWFEARAIAFKVVGSFLLMSLPSGRSLYYPYPQIQPIKTWWGAIKDAVTFMGIDNRNGSPTKGKWTRLATYGGKLVENATQAVARDVLAEAMFRLEEHGYPIVMHVHDEIVCETPAGFGSVKEFEEIMAEVPTWAAGFPVKVEAWSGDRYRK